jgi:hypothetical protein
MLVQAGRRSMHRVTRRLSDAVMAYCYRIEGEIWDTLLYENYRSLLDQLDSEQMARRALCSERG